MSEAKQRIPETLAGLQGLPPGAVTGMAAAHFWRKALEFDDLIFSFSRTSSDVVMVEVLYWCLCVIGKMMASDLNTAIETSPKDARGTVKAPLPEMDNLIALRIAFDRVHTEIKTRTGWDILDVAGLRMKEYGECKDTEKLIGAFTRRLLASVGKQSIDDEDTAGFKPAQHCVG